MKTLHTAFYISNSDDKNDLLAQITSGELIPEIKDLKGAVYSDITIDKFIAEEKRHGRFNVATETKNRLQHSSSGEQKKALLAHIISKKPAYIIVDNIFDNLDVNSQVKIVETLTEMSNATLIIQISVRKRDMLPFIKKVVSFQNESTHKQFVGSIPNAYEKLPIENNPLVKFNNVTVKYGDRTIVKNICWEIKTNEFWHLIGPNGVGKSTLLNLIYGENVKGYGQDVILFGRKKGSGESIWDIKKKIGYFSSEMTRGFSRLDTVEKMLLSGFFDSVGLYVKPTNAQLKLADEWLQLLGLFNHKNKRFTNLTLGQQRLVLIARAMIKHPPLLILDEPTASLDDATALLFTALVNKISRETQTTILYVSHRKEIGLNPNFIFELTPTEIGAVGEVII